MAFAALFLLERGRKENLSKTNLQAFLLEHLRKNNFFVNVTAELVPSILTKKRRSVE
jgi:hypothetical protein